MATDPGTKRSLSKRFATPDRLRRSTLMFADPAPAPLPPADSVTRQRPRPTGEPHPRYPWRNLAFEGGGAKGYAYVGAMQALEESGLYPLHIERVSGTSVGSLMAMFVAVGASSQDLLELVPKDVTGLIMDGGGGYLGTATRTMVARGMHPGQRTFTFLGRVLEEFTGSADITFAQLLERCGRELCVPVTNVTRMMTEYCHPKTTPNMPVRVAVRMSMSLPVLLQPVLLQRIASGARIDGAEVYVDGGLLCNNPTHAFDGWWLSLAPEDSFMRRIGNLSEAPNYYPRSMRFSPENPETLGFTLFSADESDLTRTWLRPGGGPPSRPSTPASLRCQEEERRAAEQRAVPEPLQRILASLSTLDLNKDGLISKDEFQRAVDVGNVTADELRAGFGVGSGSELFDELNIDGNEYIDFWEVVAFIEARGGDLTTQLVGFPARPPKNLVTFAGNLFDAVCRDLSRANYSPHDEFRTVAICTDYVTTRTFDLAQADLDFLVASAWRSTTAFLRDYDENPGASAGMTMPQEATGSV